MARFHINEELRAGARLELPDGIARHVRVLRLRQGEEIVLFDGRGGEYAASLMQQDRAGIVVRLGAHCAIEREAPLQVRLIQGVSSGERMDYTIQKSVELGVAAIQPVLAEKSVVRLDAARAAAKVLHWRRVAIAACEQCGRNRIPSIESPVTLAAFIATSGPGGLRVLLSAQAAKGLKDVFPTHARNLELAVGPEGGFNAAEEASLAQAGFAAARLGPRVLRTETAAPAALAALNALAGEF